MALRAPSRAACTLILGTVVLVATTIFAQQNARPRSNDEVTTKQVCAMISKYHISHAKIDDDVSRKLLKRFIKVLDPQKLYFIQADIDFFEGFRDQLDDYVKVGNVDFAYTAYDRYLTNVKEQIASAVKQIDVDHDFGIEESMVIDADELEWAADKKALAERWRKRIKWDLLNIKLQEESKAKDGKPDAAEIMKIARERLHKRNKNLLRMLTDVEDIEKLELYLSSLTHCFDPHSSYMSPDTLKEFQIVMSLRLEGIGAALRSEDGYTTVAQIIEGGAADADGRLKVGDTILGVGSTKDSEIEDIVEMKLSKVVKRIRGKRGTLVKLQVKKGDTNEIVQYDLVRRTIDLSQSSAVRGEIIETGERLDGRKARIGVINIPSFYRDFEAAKNGVRDFKSTARDLQKVLTDFEQQGGVDGLVIDLRMNGGGALAEAIEVSGLFVDEGPVVQVKAPGGDVKSHDDEDSGVRYDGPLVVVCNRLSASATEIFAGVIKDYRRGVIVGDTTTHGKGTVQNVMPVGQLFQFLNNADRGALKLTIQQFYRVNGDSTQNRGVTSDIVLPSVIDHMDLGESFLDNALAFDRVEAAAYQSLDFVNRQMLATLAASSKKRVKGDDDFQELQKGIDRYVTRKNRKEVSLNESVIRQEREEDKQNKKENEDDEKNQVDSRGKGPVFPDNFYNNEVLQITVDYIQQIGGAKTVQK